MNPNVTDLPKSQLEQLEAICTLAQPEKTVRSPKEAGFAGMKGIVVVKGIGWGDARGHVTLWDGVRCSDVCHLMHDPENGRFIPQTASIWILK
ncbi:MAG: T6SS effector amidase Tae4 family protein [Nitrospira sp.]